MSARELMEWSVFEETFGPLTLHERMDGAAAIIAFAHTGQGNVSDYMPRWEKETKGNVIDWLSAISRKT